MSLEMLLVITFYLSSTNPLPAFPLNWDILPPYKVPNVHSIEGLFSEKEIKDSAFSLRRDKSPRLDGFSLYFYHYFWDLIKEDLFQAFHFFFHSQDTDILRQINQTLIVLILMKLSAEIV